MGELKQGVKWSFSTHHNTILPWCTQLLVLSCEYPWGGCLECVCVFGGGARCPVGHRASVCVRVCAYVRARARACSSTRYLKYCAPPCLPGHTNRTAPCLYIRSNLAPGQKQLFMTSSPLAVLGCVGELSKGVKWSFSTYHATILLWCTKMLGLGCEYPWECCLECVCVFGGGMRCPVVHRASVCVRVCAYVRVRARACSSTHYLKNFGPPCLPGHANHTAPLPWT